MRRFWLVAFALVALVVAGTLPAVARQAPPTEKPKEAATAADPISGGWDGTAVMPNGSQQFFMNLKLEGDKVTGDIGNQEGSTATSGTWADGKLSLSFVYTNGETMTLTGVFKEGQLAGDIASASFQMTFVAKKKA